MILEAKDLIEHRYFSHAHAEVEQEEPEEEGGRGNVEGLQGYKGVSTPKGKGIVLRSSQALSLPGDHSWLEFLEVCEYLRNSAY